MANPKIAIVCSEFNSEITEEMCKVAKKHAKEIGLDVVGVIKVPGAYEIPLAAAQLLRKGEIDGVATLGTIIKGQTDHDAVIGHAVAQKLLDLSIQYNKPVSLGISGPNITMEQSRQRIEEYAKRAVNAIAKSLDHII